MKESLKYNLVTGIRVLLALLFLYAAVAKLADFSMFYAQLQQSPLVPVKAAKLLAAGVPLSEIVLAGMLLYRSTHFTGLMTAYFLMLFFSLYLIILFTSFSRTPCACGGILGHMGYPLHIAFNLFFTVLSLLGIWLSVHLYRLKATRPA